MKPMPRLLDDPALAPELRSDLMRVVSAPIGYDTKLGLAAFQVAIGASLAASVSSAAAAKGAEVAVAQANAAVSAGQAASGLKGAGLLSAMGIKATLVAVGAATAIATTVFMTGRGQPARSPAARHPAMVQSSPQIAAAPSVETTTSGRTSESNTVQSPNRTTRASGPSRVSTRVDSDAALRREIAQLGKIKALLDKRPAEAYRLTQTGHRDFGRGMLRQEREALAVLALWNLGRHAEAQRRAQAFVVRYPQSPLRERLQHLLRAESE